MRSRRARSTAQHCAAGWTISGWLRRYGLSARSRRPPRRARELTEAGLLPEPRLAHRLRGVIAARDGRDPPSRLPEPPASWARDCAVLIADQGSVPTPSTPP